MKRALGIVGFAAIVCALAVGAGVVNADRGANADKNQKRIAVRALAAARIPAVVTSATATRADNGAVLSYTVANRGGERLTSLQVVAFVINRDGAITGGEGWTLTADLDKNASQAFSTILEQDPSAEGRVAVAVRRAAGPSGVFEAENNELVNQVKSYAGVASAAPVFTKAGLGRAPRQATYCQGALAMAESACSCGVGSFSCNDAQQNFSFTCNKPPEGQAACASGPVGE